MVLHGILGTRANWRGIARRLVEARPEWGAVLVDLREHGESLGRLAPHTVDAAATDVIELEAELGLRVEGVLGHSFGGKVALRWLAQRDGDAECWLVDSSPSARSVDGDSTTTGEVIRTLEKLGRSWSSRDAFVRALVDAGQPEPIAHWLAMNLRRNADGTRVFGPTLSVIRSLIEDYANTDLWPIVESLPKESVLDVVIGGRSDVFTESDRARFARIAAGNSRVSMHVIEEAGHWVHVDAPQALLTLLTSRLGKQR